MGQEPAGVEAERHPLELFAAGGEMGALMRSMDWSRTALGPVEGWSQSLRSAVTLLLSNRFPLLLWWGPEQCQLYNDAYRPVLGTKHPRSMGQPARECWPEIWHIIGPLVLTPYNGGPATWAEDLALEPNRHGFLEETHFTVAYSPVPDPSAPSGIGGVLATVHETSRQVVQERRVVALRDLGARNAEKTAEAACSAAARILARHPLDIPFALLYLTDAAGTEAHLAGTAGVETTDGTAPARVDLTHPASEISWPLAEVYQTKKACLVDGISRWCRPVPPGPWSDPPDRAMVLPIPSTVPDRPAGLAVFGISARLAFDELYESFFELAASQIAAAIGNARAFEEERKRAEALAELDRAKTAFFSNVSHEFRTPLTLMLGPLEDALAEVGEPLPKGHRQRLEVAHRNSQRLLRLVNTLLDFSRIEAGRVQASFEPVDLCRLTQDLASNFRSAMERAGLEFDVQCGALRDPVYVDRDMWEKVVLNLVSNAFKFTLEGRVTVRIEERAGEVELAVTDTGCGIPEPELPQVFQRFHRVEGTRGRTYEGTGIGLALVHELVKLHGGTVSVESELGRGSTFRVVLPKGTAHLPADRIGAARSLASTAMGARPFVEEALRWLPDGRPEREADDFAAVRDAIAVHPDPSARILVADDNADMREYVSRLLAGHYQVETVADGQAAVRAAQARPPDLVLSDVMMPGLDGFGVLRALRGNPGTTGVPVILLSARAGEESRMEGLGAGADDYLVKPFSARELLARVSSQLELARVRRAGEEALRHRSSQYETLLNQAPLGVYLVDAELRLREANPVALSSFGDVPGGLIGREIREVLHALGYEEHAEEILRLFRHTLETGEPYIASERTAFRAEEGLPTYYEWRLDRITLPDGRYGLVSYFRDISAQVTARKALEESREALRVADRRKDEFLAMLGHELRNPLAAVRNAVATAALDPSRQDKALEIARRQADQLGRLIDDLLDVARITQGRITLRKEQVYLAEILSRAVEALRATLEHRGQHLSVKLPVEPIQLEVDAARLEQVVVNLLHNASKYSEAGATIHLLAAREAGQVVIRVQDTGLGIAPEMLPRVFDLFAQADSTPDRAQGGLGIGLTVARRLVELHGGTIEARSDGLGQGAEFTLHLPALMEPAGAPAAPPPLSLARSGAAAPTHVLLIEDNRDAAESLAMLLEILGHRVRVAYDGEAAVEAARADVPDIMLVDLGLPGLDGYEVARRIRREPTLEHTVLVALTGYGRDEDKQRSVTAGFEHHLVKPVAPEALGDLIRRLGKAPAQ